MDNEVWFPIVGYETTHEVSNIGRVKSLAKSWVSGRHNSVRFTEDKILSPITTRLGYLTVNIHRDGVRKVLKIHRLVATAFIPNPQNKQEVNHKNGVKTNNEVGNLEWATKSENNKHAYDTGLNPKTKKVPKVNCQYCGKQQPVNMLKRHIHHHHKSNQ